MILEEKSFLRTRAQDGGGDSLPGSDLAEMLGEFHEEDAGLSTPSPSHSCTRICRAKGKLLTM